MKACYFCGSALADDIRVYRSSTCPSCAKDLKICNNCRFYRKGAHWDCLESIPELVADKDRANFCEFFQIKDSKAPSPAPDRQKKAKEDFQKLFGNG